MPSTQMRLYSSCTVMRLGGMTPDVEHRYYGVTVLSDSLGAKVECREAALKLGITLGDDATIDGASAVYLSPEKRRCLEVLRKISDRMNSMYRGEARNAQQIFERRRHECSRETLQELLLESVNAARSLRYVQKDWSKESLMNMVTVIFIGESYYTDFFRSVADFVSRAHVCCATQGKRIFEGKQHVSLSFVGRLSVVLDAAYLAILAVDLAFAYANGKSYRQTRLSGFLEGIAVKRDCIGETAFAAAEKEVAFSIFGVAAAASPPIKRSRNSSFEAAYKEGKASRKKLRLVEAIEA